MTQDCVDMIIMNVRPERHNRFKSMHYVNFYTSLIYLALKVIVERSKMEKYFSIVILFWGTAIKMSNAIFMVLYLCSLFINKALSSDFSNNIVWCSLFTMLRMFNRK